MKKLAKKSFCLIFGLLVLNGCKSKTENNQIKIEEAPVQVQKGSHSWYYFNHSGFVAVDKPANVPFSSQTPWTEAVRISSANSAAASTVSGNSSTRAYAVVNRLGILVFDNDSVSLSKDVNLFADRTAGNLVFLNDTPLFSVYKSAFFNDSITDPLYKKDNSQHLFLVQFDETAKIAYPVVNCNNICDELNSEVTDFVWDGLNWLCSVKTISDVKNSFSYVSWKPSVSLLSISPSSAKDSIVTSESDFDAFKNAKSQLDYKNAPERIKKLLAGFDKNLPFYIDVKTAGGSSSRKYLNAVASSGEKELQAKAIISQSWSSVLFEDGTLFIEGALPGKHILRGGKPVAVRLPKLPAGFVYSDFVISGTTLYAAWEESAFYKTGRSGFIEVNLDKTLYSKLI